MKPGGILVMISWIAICFLSCRKIVIDRGKVSGPAVEFSDKEKLRARLNKEVAEILEKVYQRPDAYYEANAAIYSSYYEDERVLLRDLLFPDKSALYKTERFKSFHAKEGVFRNAFNEVMDSGDYPYLEKEGLHMPQEGTRSSSVNGQAAIENFKFSLPLLSKKTGIAIYFPYSENFSVSFAGMYRDSSGNFVKQNIATIVPTDRDADEGIGREVFDCGIRIGAPVCFRSVAVNDDYAAQKPTHIVGAGAEEKAAIISEPVAAQAVYRVYNGSSRLTKQLDRLISLTGNGGGSEIKIARISGYLEQKDQQVNGFAGDVSTAYYKRGDIREEKWMRIFSIWDPNWEPDDIEQVYAVYEEDTEGVSKFKGALTTTVNLPGKPSLGKAEGEIGFDISVITQDEIITQRRQDRYSYMRDAFNNQGWAYIKDANDFLPLNKDWPIFDGGTIWQYTWPFRVY